jgi:hypothetical protein
MRIGELADRLERAADRLTAGGAALSGADPGATAFGADNPGRLGEVGRALHRRWSSALTARSGEATAQGTRLADTGAAIRVAAGRYRDTESDAGSRHDIEVS